MIKIVHVGNEIYEKQYIYDYYKSGKLIIFKRVTCDINGKKLNRKKRTAKKRTAKKRPTIIINDSFTLDEPDFEYLAIEDIPECDFSGIDDNFE